MSPEERDPAHLWDMLQAARAVLRFTKGATAEAYREQEMLRAAVEREIEIVGEAARRVSATFRAAHPEIPWRNLIAQRNVMIHEYGEIDHSRIWRLVVEHIPALVEQLMRLVPPTPGEGDS
jgi:uncharacterized protein with HEPN domain